MNCKVLKTKYNNTTIVSDSEHAKISFPDHEHDQFFVCGFIGTDVSSGLRHCKILEINVER